MTCSYNGILNKKDQTTDIYNDTNESPKNMLSERSQIKSAYVYEIQPTNLWQQFRTGQTLG